MLFRPKGGERPKILPLLALIICVPLVMFLFSSTLGSRTSEEDLTLVEQSIRRAAVQCYALEGSYPPSLDYLTENYGLSVDLDRFMVDYQFVASNLVPDVTVLYLDGGHDSLPLH